MLGTYFEQRVRVTHSNSQGLSFTEVLPPLVGRLQTHLQVSRKEKDIFSPAQPNEKLKRQVHVLAVDCGIKNNIIRHISEVWWDQNSQQYCNSQNITLAWTLKVEVGNQLPISFCVANGRMCSYVRRLSIFYFTASGCGWYVWTWKASLAMWFVLKVPLKRASHESTSPFPVESTKSPSQIGYYATVPEVTKVSGDPCPWFLPSLLKSQLKSKSSSPSSKFWAQLVEFHYLGATSPTQLPETGWASRVFCITFNTFNLLMDCISLWFSTIS